MELVPIEEIYDQSGFCMFPKLGQKVVLPTRSSLWDSPRASLPLKQPINSGDSSSYKKVHSGRVVKSSNERPGRNNNPLPLAKLKRISTTFGSKTTRVLIKKPDPFKRKRSGDKTYSERATSSETRRFPGSPIRERNILQSNLRSMLNSSSTLLGYTKSAKNISGTLTDRPFIKKITVLNSETSGGSFIKVGKSRTSGKLANRTTIDKPMRTPSVPECPLSDRNKRSSSLPHQRHRKFVRGKAKAEAQSIYGHHMKPFLSPYGQPVVFGPGRPQRSARNETIAKKVIKAKRSYKSRLMKTQDYGITMKKYLNRGNY